MARYVDVTSTPVFLFNIANLATKLVAALATLAAALFHVLGSPLVDTALDVLVAAMLAGIVQGVIWIGVRLVFGITMEVPRS